MKDFLIAYQSEVMSAVISFSVALFTTLLTHFLGNFKLRYAERLKITSELSKRKYEGITRTRKEIGILSQYENLCITEDKESLIPEIIGKKIYTPSCCYSYKTLVNIANILNSLYGESGYYLRHRSVIYLVYIRNFFIDYCEKCKRAGLSDEELRWVSVPLYEGIHKWYKSLDKELLYSMNRPSLKYFVHSGLKYTFLLKIYGLYFRTTAPYKYMNDENSMLNQVIYNRDLFIEQYKKEIFEKEDGMGTQ